MADLVPPHVLAEVTDLLQAPYVNSFGSTETGLPPATRNLIPVGAVPSSLSKEQSAFCEIKLVDSADNEVATGIPGELAIRGPTLFSGYWQAQETNERDFRGGWFHMGDVFRRNRAEPFFNLPAEVLGGPGHAMFVHWYSPWVMSPTNDGDRRWFKRMKREWKSSFVGAPRPDQSDLLHTRSSTIFRSGAPA
jgi:acyl-CoA synthetase (AMP-forming)/AMP-acid ligase II